MNPLAAFSRLSLLKSTLLGLVILGGSIREASANKPISLNELGYSARLWSVDDGLPLNHLSTVTQTKDGYLWVATRSGLARFNGTDFKTFTRADFPSPEEPLKFDWFTSLFPDSKGRLWIGLIPNHLALYNRGEFHLFGPKEGYVPGECRYIVEGKDGEMWIINETDGVRKLLRFKDGRFEVSKTSPRHLVGGSDGVVWVVTNDGVININNDQESLPEHIAGGHPNELWGGFQSRNGLPALGHPKGIYTYQEGKWTLSHPSTGPDPRSPTWALPCESPDGFIWIPHHEQGVLVRTPSGELRRVELPSLSLSTSTFNLFCDQEGSVWVCSGEGLYQLTPTPFVSWQMDQSRTGKQVMSLAEDGQGSMWFAARGGIYHLPPEADRVQRAAGTTRFDDWFLTGLPRGGALVWDRRGSTRVWHPDTVTNLSSIFPDEVKPTRFTKFAPARSESLLVSNFSGIFRLEDSGSSPWTATKILATPEGSQFSTEGLAESNDGWIYFAPRGIGLCRFKDGEAVQVLSDPEDPTGKIVEAPRIDDKGLVWLKCGHPNGLGCWDGDSWFFREWHELDLPNQGGTVVGLIPDEVNGLWVITATEGVFHAHRDALFSRLKGDASDIDWQQFKKDDGLASSGGAFTSTSMLRTKNGNIWVASSQGASVINPKAWSAVRERLPAPNLSIESITVDEVDTSVEFQNEVIVAPGQTRFEVHFSALSYAQPDKVRYRYKLEGFDQESDWIEGENRRAAYYQGVPPGTYQFRVIASNGYGKWNEEGASLKIIVQPLWWQRSSIRFLGVAILATLVVIAYQIRIRQLRAREKRREVFSQQLIETQERERKRIAGELHDNLGQDLLLIKTSSELVSSQLEDDSPVSKRSSSITDLAAQAIANVRSITADLRPPILERLGLAAAVEVMAEKASESSSREITTEVAVLDQDWCFDEQMGIYRILQECLNNALKHANANRIAILAIEHAPNIDLIVQDDGEGFSPGQASASLDSGMGLGNIRERARILGGSIRIDSSPGLGACLTITIPIPSSQPNA